MFEGVGLGTREIYFSIGIIVLTMVGAIGNYFLTKVTGKGISTWTMKSAIRASVLGFVAGFLLVWMTKGGEGIGHYDAIFISLSWGGISESVIGKYLGWKASKGESKPDGMLVEAEKPKEPVKETVKA